MNSFGRINRLFEDRVAAIDAGDFDFEPGRA